jgi:leader peptidase (prepilin peptidase)/N-methyltransferase
MLLLYYLGQLFVRWMSRRRGQDIEEVALGYGDVNLSGVIGLLLGWPGISIGLALAIILGGLASLILIFVMVIRRQYRHDLTLPYGPFLVASAVILLYLG